MNTVLEKFIQFVKKENLNFEVIRDKINHISNIRDSEEMCICIENLEESQSIIEPTPSNVLTSLFLFYLTGPITKYLKSVRLEILEEFLKSTTEDEMLEFLNDEN